MPRPKSRRPAPPAPAADWAERDRVIRRCVAFFKSKYGEHAGAWMRAPRGIWNDEAAYAAYERRVAKAAAQPDGLIHLVNARIREEEAADPSLGTRNLHPIPRRE